MERRLPIGAEPQADGGVHFRVWAPESKKASIEAFDSGSRNIARTFELKAESDGYLSGSVRELGAGSLYKIRLDSGSFPDPASRFQPEGPHGPSQVVDPT